MPEGDLTKGAENDAFEYSLRELKIGQSVNIRVAVSETHIEKAHNSMYTSASVRRSSVIFLSLFLTYAGVAWALEACLRHAGHSDHSTFENRSDFHAQVDHDHSQDPSPPIIHCTPVTHQLGPAARIASAEILRSDRGVAVAMVSFPYTVSATLRNDLWLEAVFKRIVSFSLTIDLTRRLFLSVLRI